MIMFKIFPSGVAVDTSKIAALFIARIGTTYNIIAACCDGDNRTLIECKNEDDAKAYFKKLVDELNTMKGEFN